MKLLQKWVSFIGLILLSSAVMADEWNAYFPTNKVLKAKVMQIGASKEAGIIAEKIKKGVTEHQEWFKEYVKTLKPGEAMPYHANLGVTEAEYKTFLDSVKQMNMTQIGTVDLEFISKTNGSVQVKTTPESSINGLVVEKSAVTTPYGSANKYTTINNTQANSPTGPWTGVQWSLTEIDQKLMKGKSVKLAVGKLEKTGEGILYYDVKDIDPNKKVQFSYIVYYPLQ